MQLPVLVLCRRSLSLAPSRGRRELSRRLSKVHASLISCILHSCFIQHKHQCCIAQCNWSYLPCKQSCRAVFLGEAKKVLAQQRRLEDQKLKDEPAEVSSTPHEGDAECGDDAHSNENENSGDIERTDKDGDGGDDDDDDDDGSSGGSDDDDDDDDDGEDDDDDDDDAAAEEGVVPPQAAASSSGAPSGGSSSWPHAWPHGYGGYFMPPHMPMQPPMQPPPMPFGYPPQMGYPGMPPPPLPQQPQQKPSKGASGKKTTRGKQPEVVTLGSTDDDDEEEEEEEEVEDQTYKCDAEAEGGIKCHWTGFVSHSPAAPRLP